MNSKEKQAYRQALKDLKDYYGNEFIPFDTFEYPRSDNRIRKANKPAQRWS